MPRPKGSKNRKKRKYTRRKASLPLALAHDADINGMKAGTLVREIKEMLMEAEPEVARSAISVLIHDLAMVNKIIGGVPPAP